MAALVQDGAYRPPKEKSARGCAPLWACGKIAPVVRLIVLAAWVVVWCGISSLHAQDAQPELPQAPVATVVVRGSDRAVLPYLERLGVSVVLRQLAPFATDSDARTQANSVTEDLVLWVDGESARVGVLRKRDGMTLSRTLDVSTFSESPYVVALAATELLALMRETPAVRVEPKPATVEALPLPTPPRRAPLLVASAGAELSTGIREAPGLLRPQLALDGTVFTKERVFLFVGARAAPYGEVAQRAPGLTTGKVIYRRSDLGLRLGAGVAHNAIDVLGYAMPDVAFVRVRAEGIDSARERTRRRLSWSASLGGVFRYWLWSRVGLSFSLDVAFQPAPASYRVDGRVAFREDPVRASASFGLVARLY